MGGRSGKAVERCRPATIQGVAGLRFLRRRRQSVFSYLCHGGHMANKSSGGAASAPPRRLNWNDPDVRSVVYQVVALGLVVLVGRSEEHTSELQPLMRISYAVFCWNKKKINKQQE